MFCLDPATRPAAGVNGTSRAHEPLQLTAGCLTTTRRRACSLREGLLEAAAHGSSRDRRNNFFFFLRSLVITATTLFYAQTVAAVACAVGRHVNHDSMGEKGASRKKTGKLHQSAGAGNKRPQDASRSVSSLPSSPPSKIRLTEKKVGSYSVVQV